MWRDRRECQVGARDKSNVSDVTPMLGDRVEQELAALAERKHPKYQERGLVLGLSFFGFSLLFPTRTAILKITKAASPANAHPGPAKASITA